MSKSIEDFWDKLNKSLKGQDINDKSNNKNNVSSDEGEFDLIDGDLEKINNHLKQHWNALASLDTTDPKDIDRLRNIMLQNIETEYSMYKVINQLSKNNR